MRHPAFDRSTILLWGTDAMFPGLQIEMARPEDHVEGPPSPEHLAAELDANPCRDQLLLAHHPAPRPDGPHLKLLARRSVAAPLQAGLYVERGMGDDACCRVASFRQKISPGDRH